VGNARLQMNCLSSEIRGPRVKILAAVPSLNFKTLGRFAREELIQIESLLN
jgi:hypothetical protein